jgi:hypothetical protein
MADPPSPAHAPGAIRPVAAGRRGGVGALLRRLPPGTLSLLLTALALSLMSWPVLSLQPRPAGLDQSWATALHMAFQQGLDAGTEVLFSYGPLGFLRNPSYAFPWTTRLAFAYTFAIQLALCLALLWVLRRNLGSLLPAAPVVLVIATLTVQEPVPVLVFAIAVCVLRGEVSRRLLPWLLAATGALVAVQLLAKLNTGVVGAVLFAIALAGMADRRRALIGWFGGALAVTLVGCWVLTGQSLAGIADYVGGSLQIISGYSEAMGFEEPGRGWELWAGLALAGIGIAIIVRADGASPRRVKLTLTAMWLVLAFTAYKSGFVRHDGGHANIFFATLLGGLAVLPLAVLPRATAGLVLLFAVMTLLASGRFGPDQAITPLKRAHAFLSQGHTLADGNRLNAQIVAAREIMQRAYPLDPRIGAALRGHRTHVDPYDAAVLWAYRLPWRPVPVFQSYSAYTADLDERNAAAFGAADGPQRVLRHDTPAVDGRNRAWESPAAMRAMLCNFRELVTVGPWQVLGRVPNRCGPPRMLSETRTRFGGSIALPRSPGPRTLVYMTLDGVAVAGLERIATALHRASDRAVVFDGRTSYRLVPGTAADGLIVRVPPAIDLSAPFSLTQRARRIAVTRGTRATDDEIRVRFYAVDMS